VNLQQIDSSLSKMQTFYTKAQGRKELLEESLSLAQDKLETVQNSIVRGELVQVLLTKTSDFARAQLKTRIEATVTAGIQAIFQNDDEFFVEMGEFRGQAAADWRVKTPNGTVDVENSDGGGIVDTLSMALRVAVMETSRPKPGGPVFLDESGKHLSREYLPNMAEFLKQYTRTAGRQTFLITHWSELAEIADVSYVVIQDEKGISGVKRCE